MKIQILFFGIANELVGTEEVFFLTPENCSVTKLKEIIVTQYPQLTNLNSYFIAVNEVYATGETILKENDEVAILPPVSGG